MRGSSEIAFSQRLCSLMCQWQVAVLVEAHQCFHGDAQLMHQFFRNALSELHIIIVLDVVWFLVRFSVKIDDMVFYL